MPTEFWFVSVRGEEVVGFSPGYCLGGSPPPIPVSDMGRFAKGKRLVPYGGSCWYLMSAEPDPHNDGARVLEYRSSWEPKEFEMDSTGP